MSRDALKGKTALVTGGAKRIGREISIALADAGANVLVHCRRAGDAQVLCASLIKRGVKAWSIEADLEDLRQTEELFARAVGMAGQIDILVNNASIFLPSTVDSIDYAGLMRHMQINAWAPFVLSRELSRQSVGGKVINLLDCRITGNDSAHLAYSLSKQALATLTMVMAREFAPGVTVNGIAPGLILPPSGQDERHLDALAKTVPLQRHGDPANIAEAALYLLGSEFVTGQLIFVDGGQHLTEQCNGPNHY